MAGLLFRRRPRAALSLFGACALALALSLLAAAPALSQGRLEGRVVRGGQGVPGAAVTLHRVTRDTSGAVANARAGVDGAFSVALPPPPPRAAGDTSGFIVFFATADVDGVRYFGPPVHAGDARSAYEITAFDTTSAKAAVDSLRIARRDVAMIPTDGGGWEIGEVVRVENRAGRTLVPAGGKPVVGFAVPAEISAFEVGEGEVRPDEVARVGDRVWLTSPFPPGTREIFLRYVIPPTVAELAVRGGYPTDTLNVFVRKPGPAVTVQGLSGPSDFQAEGQVFSRYSAYRLDRAARVTVEWHVPMPSPVDPRIAAVALAALVLGAGAWAALRRGGTPPGGDPRLRAAGAARAAPAPPAGEQGGAEEAPDRSGAAVG